MGGVTETLSTTMSQSFSTSDSHYWGVSTETDLYVDLSNSTYNGMYVWQWVYDIQDPYSNQCTTRSDSLAITPNIATPPLCLPGYQTPNSGYQTCISAEGTLPTPSRRRSLLRGSSGVEEYQLEVSTRNVLKR